jgi:hypothetical protein
MEINKLIKKYQDKLINITEARASDNEAGDHTFNMEYDEGEKNINEFIVDLKELEAINYTHCCTELPTKYSIAFAGFVATNVEVQGNKIKVLDSMNGWGNKIPSKSISIIKK